MAYSSSQVECYFLGRGEWRRRRNIVPSGQLRKEGMADPPTSILPWTAGTTHHPAFPAVMLQVTSGPAPGPVSCCSAYDVVSAD